MTAPAALASDDARAVPSGPVAALLTALAYAVVGWLALQLTIPPGHASPIYPSAGIALVAALTYGRWGLAGAALGAFTVNLLLAAERAPFAAETLLSAALIGAGVALQAGLGSVLVRRFVRQPLTLSEPDDLLRFMLLGAPVACVASASVATATLMATGFVAPAGALTNWWTWWTGDSLGVLIGAPIALTLIGRPRAEWAPRRLVVALPMLAASTLLALATLWVVRAHDQRVRATFEHEAQMLAENLDARLRGPHHALLAMHGLFDLGGPVGPEAMARAARVWTAEQPFLLALGYSARVARAELPAFEASARAQGPAADYAVFDRPEAAVAGDADVVAIRYIEPLAPNRRALGVNALSIPAARAAIERAQATGLAAATAGFRLTQAAGDETGIVLYRPLYEGEPADEAGRRRAFSGVVFATLRLDALVGDLPGPQAGTLDWCLIDPQPGVERVRLAGPAGCQDRAPAVLSLDRALSFGGRELLLRVQDTGAATAGVADSGGWLFSVIGLLATSLLGALLLLISGRQQRIEAAVEDRTRDLAQAGQALLESQERLRNIVDHVPIGVIYTDAEGRVGEANPALLALLGLPALPQPAPRLVDWTHPDDRAGVAEAVAALGAGGATLLRRQVRMLARGQDPVQVQLSVSALLDADGRPHRLVGVVEDIGEHLRLLESERAREQAEAASRTKSEFVGRMSHELRTPLNAMLGFAQLLSRDESGTLAPHQQRWAGQIQDAGWHLLNMINDTLDLSMIESGSVRLTPRVLSPEALVEATVPLLAAQAERRQVRLVPPRVERSGLLLLGDETRVRQILTNLLSNAVKYNAEGGEVEVIVRAGARDRVEILVRDTGLGLTPAQRGALFQPFNRLGRESSGVEGTGIGLVISRRLAELMGGQLDLLETSPATGTTFVLGLPAVSDAGAAADTGWPGLESANYRSRHVHYVEDNETNVVLLRGMLAQRPQIRLTVSTLGLDALVAVRTDPPDLLLLDMHLPDIDGMDLLRHLKADDASAGLPVLVLSADATPERIAQALAAGAAGYLSKPLDLAELLARIDELLGAAETRAG